MQLKFIIMKKLITTLLVAITLFTTSANNSLAAPTKNTTACDLKSDMRKLWEEHIMWTRNVIFNIIDELPGTTEAVNRLLQNQVDIGNAIKPYYGDAAGNQLTALLHDHITTAADLLVALKNDNTTAFNTAYNLWLANADAIAAFLSSANPNWPLAEMQAMMRDHLDHTASEAAARKNADYVADVAAYDQVHFQILEMADMLTEGIVKQFPNKFGSCDLREFRKPTACDLKSDMRKLWEDHILWTRNVIFNIIDELPGTTEAVNRLLQNQVDIGNAIKPYYCDAAGNQLTALLHDHITTAADLLVALKNDNTTAFNAAYTAWLANADAIAGFLSSANPNWPLAKMQAMMRDHLDHTAAEAAARKNADYVADVAAFDDVHTQILEMADMLTDGIVKLFRNMFAGCPVIPSHSNRPSGNIKLYQNSPNPSNDKTVISYYIPESVRSAELIVYDNSGLPVKKFQLYEKGNGSIIMNTEALRRGVYSYSILADGKIAATRKMIH
jgi:hypothetical protein